jgi:hypothetical protein
LNKKVDIDGYLKDLSARIEEELEVTGSKLAV